MRASRFVEGTIGTVRDDHERWTAAVTDVPSLIESTDAASPLHEDQRPAGNAEDALESRGESGGAPGHGLRNVTREESQDH
jgi:hypothetical protein